MAHQKAGMCAWTDKRPMLRFLQQRVSCPATDHQHKKHGRIVALCTQGNKSVNNDMKHCRDKGKIGKTIKTGKRILYLDLSSLPKNQRFRMLLHLGAIHRDPLWDWTYPVGFLTCVRWSLLVGLTACHLWNVWHWITLAPVSDISSSILKLLA